MRERVGTESDRERPRSPSSHTERRQSLCQEGEGEERGQCTERECLDVRQGECLKLKLMLREESKALGRALDQHTHKSTPNNTIRSDPCQHV